MIELIEEAEKVDLTDAITMICDQLENNPEKFEDKDSWREDSINKLVINIVNRTAGLDKVLNDEEIQRVTDAYRNFQRVLFNQQIITLILSKPQEEEDTSGNNINALKQSMRATKNTLTTSTANNNLFGQAQIKQEGATIGLGLTNSIANNAQNLWGSSLAGNTSGLQNQYSQTAQAMAAQQNVASHQVDSMRYAMELELKRLRNEVDEHMRYGYYQEADDARRKYKELEGEYQQVFLIGSQPMIEITPKKKGWWSKI
jgi:hypothetical protein